VLQLGDGGGIIRGAAGQCGDFLHRLVVDRHWLTLAVDLDVAVWGAERDGGDRYTLIFGGARRGVAAADHRADGGDRLQRGEDGFPGSGAVLELKLVDRRLDGAPVGGGFHQHGGRTAIGNQSWVDAWCEVIRELLCSIL